MVLEAVLQGGIAFFSRHHHLAAGPMALNIRAIPTMLSAVVVGFERWSTRLRPGPTAWRLRLTVLPQPMCSLTRLHSVCLVWPLAQPAWRVAVPVNSAATQEAPWPGAWAVPCHCMRVCTSGSWRRWSRLTPFRRWRGRWTSRIGATPLWLLLYRHRCLDCLHLCHEPLPYSAST